MEHIIDTHHDIQNADIDKLRSIYTGAGLAVQTKTKISQLETIKK
jgi:hypothetical protein